MCAVGCAYDVIIEKQAKQEDIAFLVDRGNTDTHTHLGHVPNHITKKTWLKSIRVLRQVITRGRRTNRRIYQGKPTRQGCKLYTYKKDRVDLKTAWHSLWYEKRTREFASLFCAVNSRDKEFQIFTKHYPIWGICVAYACMRESNLKQKDDD